MRRTLKVAWQLGQLTTIRSTWGGGWFERAAMNSSEPGVTEAPALNLWLQ
jgi:hypothetical protein